MPGQFNEELSWSIRLQIAIVSDLREQTNENDVGEHVGALSQHARKPDSAGN
jgi:hypothetical protein